MGKKKIVFVARWDKGYLTEYGVKHDSMFWSEWL